MRDTKLGNALTINGAEILKTKNFIMAWEKEYDILTDQYMNGDIVTSIGRTQRAYMRKINTYRRKLNRLEKRRDKLLRKRGDLTA